nr:MAG TPA: hypothetical protein [Bacteriophage sp.]
MLPKLKKMVTETRRLPCSNRLVFSILRVNRLSDHSHLPP